MWKVLFRARDRFARDQRGNVAILFAVSAVPIIGLIGGAVDLTRHSRYKTQIMNAMDSAAIALVRRGAESDADADRFVNDYIAAMLPYGIPDAPQAAAASPMMRSAAASPAQDEQAPKAPAPDLYRDTMLHMQRFDAVQIDGGWRVVSDGYMDTAFMPLVGIEQMGLDLQSEVMMSGGNYEIALVLDNTGSMAQRGRMQALRDAAGTLVDDLYKEPGTDERVKMALVPFVTAVNINTRNVFQNSWIQPTVDPARDMNFRSPDGKAVNRLTLFNQMGVAWKGCVEARTQQHDEDDTEPTDAVTRWVPYLWPDEPDDRGYGNDYLEDSGRGGDWNRLRDTAKYGGPRRRQVADTTSRGPNAACPRAIVELTNDTKRMHDEIRLMKPHNEVGGNNSGTNVAQGLAWGWRVLSPEEPFSQGASYDDGETSKFLVLLSDGRNQIVANNDETESDYTSYGYLAEGRLDSDDDYLVAEGAVDEKVTRICEKVKAKGIRVYTILFQVDFERTQDIFRDCASKDQDGKPLYYYVPAASELETAFSKIGEDMTSLRVTR